jgi:hypothetical protein
VVEAVDDVVQDQAICSLGAAPMLCHLAKVLSFEPWLLVSFPAYKFNRYKASPTSIHYCYQRQQSYMRRATLADGCVVEETSAVKAWRKDNNNRLLDLRRSRPSNPLHSIFECSMHGYPVCKAR